MNKIPITKKTVLSGGWKSGLNCKYLRKWQYNFLIVNGVPESVADYIQGRTPETVGSMHYLSRVKQADFWFEKVIEKLENVFNRAPVQMNANWETLHEPLPLEGNS